MADDVYYRVLDNKIAHEMIDGEVVVIHFDSGNYYSIEGVSAGVWQWLASGASRNQVRAALGELTPEQTKRVDGFIDLIVSEKLMEVTETPHDPVPVIAPNQTAFEVLELRKYNDMQTLLLSDPIHDVDETGWPNLEAGGA